MLIMTSGVDLHVTVLHCCPVLTCCSGYFRIWRGPSREGEKWKKEKKHFFLACVMIVKWHVSSLRFLDARVWNAWYFPHEKYCWLQRKEHGRRNSPDGASLHGCGYGHGFVDVISENGTDQAVIRAVGSLYHFLDSLELHYLLDRAENLKSQLGVRWRSVLHNFIQYFM